jgi:hypothetical protein
VRFTGYPTFFNEETIECNDYSFGYWKFYKPLLTVELRTRINDKVREMNAQIRDAVTRADAKWGPGRVEFVDTNPAFESHRFCEPGVHEPDLHNPNTWFFLIDSQDSPTVPSLPPPPPQDPPPDDFNPAECEEILGRESSTLGEEWAKQILCAIIKGLSEGLELEPWVNETLASGPQLKETTQQIFHPKSRGNQAVKDAVKVKVRAREDLHRFLVMYQGSSSKFQFLVSQLRKSTAQSKIIQRDGIDLRAYSTWLAERDVHELRLDPDVVGISLEKFPEPYTGFPTASAAAQAPSEAGSILQRDQLMTRQETMEGVMDMQGRSPDNSYDIWHLERLSKPPHFTGIDGNYYWQYPGYVNSPDDGRGVNIYVLDTGINIAHNVRTYI